MSRCLRFSEAFMGIGSIMSVVRQKRVGRAM